MSLPGTRRLRTAFIEAVKRTATGELRASLTLGGRSVLAWQADLMQALGCERFICLSHGQSHEILQLQRTIEGAGGTFHTIRGTLQLTGLVHADDEFVMLRDGLVPDETLIQSLVGTVEGEVPNRLQQGIATIPATHPLAENNPDDFERIDRERHWAGFAVMRASHVHQLADFPPDGEAMSLLLRLALQARVECSALDIVPGDDAKWVLFSDAGSVAEREKALISARGSDLSDSGFSGAAAEQFVSGIAPRWLANGSEASAALAGVLGLSSVAILSWSVFGGGPAAIAPWALILLALATLGAETGIAWGRLRSALWPRSRAPLVVAKLRGAMDITAAACLILASGFAPNLVVQTCLPLFAIALARLAAEGSVGMLSGFWRDRALHLTGFAVTAVGGVLSEALALFTLGAVAQLMLRGRAN